MGRPAITVKYPLEPLAKLMGMTPFGAAKALGMDDSAYCGYKRNGMSEAVAEKYAVRAGLTPWEIWPEWGTKPCADCGSRFIPLRKDARFCSTPCYRRWWAREVARKRRANPVLAERNRQRRRAYYAENGEYERARERRRYQQRKVA